MRLFIFGLGYTAARLAHAALAQGAQVTGTRRTPRPEPGVEVLAFDDPAVARALAQATHVLSSVPPDAAGDDPVLARFGPALGRLPQARWIGYLSSTGVYGDAKGGWVTETSPTGGGRRDARTKADQAWQTLPAYVFRLPGIYGPSRSALERVRAGQAHRIDLPGHVFSRIHVDDIVSAVLTAMSSLPAERLFNVADEEPASGNAVTEYACDLLGLAYPPLQRLEDANLSPMARGFYAESRRVDAGRIRQALGWSPRYPTYREGLRALAASLDCSVHGEG